jgi:hypothetical protein
MRKFLVEDISAEEWALLGEQWRGLVDCPPRGEGWEQPTRGIWLDPALRFTVAADVADKDDEEATYQIKRILSSAGDLDDDADELRAWGRLEIVQAVRRRALRENFGVQ